MKKELQNEEKNSILDGYRLKINKNPALVQKGRDKYLIFFRPSDSSLQREDVESVLQAAYSANMCIGYNLDLFREGVIAIYFNPLIQEQTARENVSKRILDSILKDREESLIEELEEEKRYEEFFLEEYERTEEEIPVVTKIIPLPLQ